MADSRACCPAERCLIKPQSMLDQLEAKKTKMKTNKQISNSQLGKTEKENKQTNKQTPAHRSIGALPNEALVHGDWSVTNSLAGNNVWSSDNHQGLPDYPIEILYIYAHVPLLTQQHLLNSKL